MAARSITHASLALLRNCREHKYTLHQCGSTVSSLAEAGTQTAPKAASQRPATFSLPQLAIF